jgi:hypothetical protein
VIALADRRVDQASGTRLDALGVAEVVCPPYRPAVLINAVGRRLLDRLAA